MKLQNLVVIFIIIILPVVLILSFYISNSLKTVEFQALYDNGLINASHDALYAFEMNTANDEFSENPEIKRDILNASIKMYEKSLCNTCNISSYNTNEIEEYIPAIVFGMYDGFYMYAPSYNSVTRKYEHSLKNYVYYTETLEGLGKDGKDITVAYSLDNRITVTGDFGEGYKIVTGYLQNINIGNGEEYSGKEYNNIAITKENIDEEENEQAQLYYRGAYTFSLWFLKDSGIEWPDYLQISASNNPEDENSKFVKHKRKIIKEKITGVLNSTITAYSQRTWGQHYKMPKLSEKDWDKVYSNISMISFFQGKEIGLTKYNGYTVVNSTNSREYANSSLMYFIDEHGEYHDIRCSKCKTATTLTGYRIGEFEEKKVEELDESGDTQILYKYDHDALACYECINGSFSTNESIYEYINPKDGTATDSIKTAYWTSLGRERYDISIKPVDIKIDIKFDINGGKTGSIDLNEYCKTYDFGDETAKIIFPGAEGYTEEVQYYEYLNSTFYRTGYTFNGWSTNKLDTTRVSWDKIKNSKPYFDETYYAVWIPEDVELTLVWNYEELSTNVILKYDDKIKDHTSIKIPERDGYNFAGWSKEKEGETVEDTETVSKDTTTYYAIWELKDHEITVDYNRGLGDEDKEEVKVAYGKVVNEVLKENEPTRAGYKFAGWGTSSDSTVAITDSVTVEGDTTYYAIWKKMYTVTFVYNDGTGTELTKEFVEGDPVVFPTDMEDKREGFSFKGWNTDKDETTGITYAKVTGNTTYYAIWVRNEYTITLDPQNGEELQKITAPYNSKVDLPNDLIKIGYTLRGWSTNKEATEGEFTAIIPSNNVTTYYAVWEINKYNIVFDYNYDNKGTIRTDTDVEHGTLINFPKITRIGYTLKGWSKNAGAQIGTEEVVTSAEAIGTTMGEEIKYYAIWQINEYQVEFYKNDGTNDIYSSYKGIYNEAIEFPGTNPTRTGYTFLYWSNTQSGDAVAGNERVQATEVSGKENANKYYAIWEKNTYTVEFFKNDGTTSKHDEYTGYYNEAIKFPGTSTGNKPNPTRTGYTFLYWSNTATGGAVAGNEKIQATEVSGKANANKYYAIWEINKYTIKYNYNYDNKGIIRTDTNVVHGTNINFPSVTRTGYTFKGWNESSGATSGVTTLAATKDATYYAIWRDETSPVINSVTKSPGPGWTNKDVTVTVNATDTGSGIDQYSFDGGSTWQTSNTKTYSANTTNIRIVVKDKAGNKSLPVWNEKIENIDKQKPTISAQYIDGQIKVVVNDTGGSGINWDSFKIGNKGNTGAGVKLTQSPQYIDAKYFISGYNGLLISDNAGNQVTDPFDMTLDKESKLSVEDFKIKFRVRDMYVSGGQGYHESRYYLDFQIEECEFTRLYTDYIYYWYYRTGWGNEEEGDGSKIKRKFDEGFTIKYTSNGDLLGRTARYDIYFNFYDGERKVDTKNIKIIDTAAVLYVRLSGLKYVADHFNGFGKTDIGVSDSNFYRIPSSYISLNDM